MTLRWLRWLMDPWAEAWRRRREQLAPRSTPRYDAYPDHVPEPELRLYVEGRAARGRLLRQFVDLSGYSLHHINLASPRWQHDLIARIAEARYLLLARLAD